MLLCFFNPCGTKRTCERSQDCSSKLSARSKTLRSWNWQQSQPQYPQPPEVVVRVEDKNKTKKGKSKKHKKRSSSTSSSSSGSTDSRRDKRRSKVKRKASQSGHRLEQKDVEELQQFRRQVEIEEILASMPSMPSMPGKGAKPAQPASEPVDTVAEALSSKTKKVVLAQSQILTQDSVSKRLLEVTSWVDVKAQLSTQSAPDIKSLCAQICEHVPRNKSDCIVKIMDQLQSLD